jgi:hypothetical protein
MMMASTPILLATDTALLAAPARPLAASAPGLFTRLVYSFGIVPR